MPDDDAGFAYPRQDLTPTSLGADDRSRTPWNVGVGAAFTMIGASVSWVVSVFLVLLATDAIGPLGEHLRPSSTAVTAPLVLISGLHIVVVLGALSAVYGYRGGVITIAVSGTLVVAGWAIAALPVGFIAFMWGGLCALFLVPDLLDPRERAEVSLLPWRVRRPSLPVVVSCCLAWGLALVVLVAEVWSMSLVNAVGVGRWMFVLACAVPPFTYALGAAAAWAGNGWGAAVCIIAVTCPTLWCVLVTPFVTFPPIALMVGLAAFACAIPMPMCIQDEASTPTSDMAHE